MKIMEQNMQFIDLKTQFEQIKETVNNNIKTVLEHGKYISGPEIVELERQLAAYCDVKYCIGCSSGTDALLMPLLAWGVKPGDAILTSPFTFVATAEVIRLLGATPVFVDINEKTFNIDPKKLDEKIEQVKKEGTLVPKVIIPVDLFGQCADYDDIERVAQKHYLLLLEDAAQAFGAEYKNKKSCSFGTAAATSFFPAKPLGCYGDGGAIFTNDDDLLEKLLSIRVHGQGADKYTNVRIGINGRIDTIQAAVLLAKMTIFDKEIEMRQKVAKKYSEMLKNKVIVPFIEEHNKSVWAQFSILAESESHRVELMKKLNNVGVPTAIYYPIPLHLQQAFSDLGGQVGEFPISENIAKRIFSIPFHPYLKDEDIEKICNAF